MKKMSRIWSVVLTIAMVLSLAVFMPAAGFAAEGQDPEGQGPGIGIQDSEGQGPGIGIQGSDGAGGVSAFGDGSGEGGVPVYPAEAGTEININTSAAWVPYDGNVIYLYNGDVLNIAAAAGSPTFETVINIAEGAEVTINGPGPAAVINNLHIEDGGSGVIVHLSNLNFSTGYERPYYSRGGVATFILTGKNSFQSTDYYGYGIYKELSGSDKLTFNSAGGPASLNLSGRFHSIECSWADIEVGENVSLICETLSGGECGIYNVNRIENNGKIEVKGYDSGILLNSGSPLDSFQVVNNGEIIVEGLSFMAIYTFGAAGLTFSGTGTFEATAKGAAGIGVGFLEQTGGTVISKVDPSYPAAQPLSLGYQGVRLSNDSIMKLTPAVNETYSFSKTGAGAYRWQLSGGASSTEYLGNDNINITFAANTEGTVSLVPAPALNSIAVTTMPSKTTYETGETLNLSGMVVTATYADTGTRAVTGYTTVPANGAQLNTLGTQTVTVSYTEGGVTRTTSFTVNVTPAKALDSISVTTMPSKTTYETGETLSLAGMVVTATYNIGSPMAVTGYTTNPANGATLNTVGTQTVTVSYTEGGVTRTTSFTVNVTPIQPACTIGATPYADFRTGWNALTNGQTLTLMKDVSYTYSAASGSAGALVLNGNKDVVINAQAFNLNITNTVSSGLKIENGSKLTFTGNSAAAGRGVVTLKGGDDYSYTAEVRGTLALGSGFTGSGLNELNLEGYRGLYVNGGGEATVSNINTYWVSLYAEGNGSKAAVLGDVVCTVEYNTAVSCHLAEVTIEGDVKAVSTGLYVESYRSMTGTANVTVMGDVICTGQYGQGVRAYSNNDRSNVNVTVKGNVECTGSNGEGVYAGTRAEVSVVGDVSGKSSGVECWDGGKATVDGEIKDAAVYIRVDDVDKAKGLYAAFTTKTGYHTYTAGGASTAWVKAPEASSYITITTQPASPVFAPGVAPSGSLSVAAALTGSGTLSYQWYRNTEDISSNSGVPISGATGASFAIPGGLTAGQYAYFCEVSVSPGTATPVRSNAAVVTARDNAPTAQIDFLRERLTGLVPGGYYWFDFEPFDPDPDDPWDGWWEDADENGNYWLDGWDDLGFKMYISRTSPLDPGTAISDPQEIMLPYRPDAPAGLTGGKGRIGGVDGTMEYRSEVYWDLSWISVPAGANEVTGLADGIYWVRYKSTATAFSSMQALVAVLPGGQGDAFKIEGKGVYDSLHDAVSAAAGGDVIEMLKDFSMGTDITIGKALTINLNGKKLTSTRDIYIDAAKVSFISGSIEARQINVQNAGEGLFPALTLTGNFGALQVLGTGVSTGGSRATVNGDVRLTGNNGRVYAASYSSLTINGNVISSAGSSNISAVTAINNSYASVSGSVTATISGVSAINLCEVNIGGDVRSGVYGISASDINAKVTVGGSVYAGDMGVYSSSGMVVVEGDVFAGGRGVYAINSTVSDSDVTINGALEASDKIVFRYGNDTDFVCPEDDYTIENGYKVYTHSTYNNTHFSTVRLKIGATLPGKSLSVSPGHVYLTEKGDRADFTASLTGGVAGSDIEWKIDDKPGYITFGSSGKNAWAVANDVFTDSGTLLVTATYEDENNVIYTATATVGLLPGGIISDPDPDVGTTVKLLEKSATINTAKIDGALVPVLISRTSDVSAFGDISPMSAVSEAASVGLYVQNNRKEWVKADKFTAEIYSKDDRYIEVKALAGAKTTSNIKVVIGGVEAKEKLKLTVTAAWPKITVKAASINAFYSDAYSKFTATASDGSKVNVVGVQPAAAKDGALVSVLGGGRLAPGSGKTGKANFKLTLSLDGYYKPYKSGSTVKASVSVVSSGPKLKLAKTTVSIVPTTTDYAEYDLIRSADKNRTLESWGEIIKVSLDNDSAFDIYDGSGWDGWIVLPPDTKAGDHTLKVWYKGAAPGKTVNLKLKVKTVGATQVTASADKKAIVLNKSTPSPDSVNVNISYSAGNIWGADTDSWEFTKGGLPAGVSMTDQKNRLVFKVTDATELKPTKKPIQLELNLKDSSGKYRFKKPMKLSLSVTDKQFSFTMKPKGKIDVANPGSAITAAVKLSGTSNPVVSCDVFQTNGFFDGWYDEGLKAVIIHVKDGQKPAPGVKYSVLVDLVLENGQGSSKTINVQPAQGKGRATQSRKGVTLYKNWPYYGESVGLSLKSPKGAKLGAVRLNQASLNGCKFTYDGVNLTDGFKLERNGDGTWTIKFEDGAFSKDKPLLVMNKKKGKEPVAIGKTYTVKLELWAEGTYKLVDQNGDEVYGNPNEGKPVALSYGTDKYGKPIPKTKPTIVNIKVSIK